MNTARFETGRLVTSNPSAPVQRGLPAFFGATRAVLTDLDYVAALWHGRSTPDESRRRLATSAKTVTFVREVLAPGSGVPAYDDFAKPLMDLYRHGTVHLRAPKTIRDPNTGRRVEWALMGGRSDGVSDGSGGHFQATHLQPLTVAPSVLILPVSVTALLEDYLAACDWLAAQYIAEAATAQTDLRDRWRSAADLMVTPEDESDPAWWAPFPEAERATTPGARV